MQIAFICFFFPSSSSGILDLMLFLDDILFKSKLYIQDKDKDKDLFIDPHEFVVGYSKAPEQPQSSARPICHSHAMTRTGREPATIRIAA